MQLLLIPGRILCSHGWSLITLHMQCTCVAPMCAPLNAQSCIRNRRTISGCCTSGDTWTLALPPLPHAPPPLPPSCSRRFCACTCAVATVASCRRYEATSRAMRCELLLLRPVPPRLWPLSPPPPLLPLLLVPLPVPAAASGGCCRPGTSNSPGSTTCRCWCGWREPPPAPPLVTPPASSWAALPSNAAACCSSAACRCCGLSCCMPVPAVAAGRHTVSAAAVPAAAPLPLSLPASSGASSARATGG
jgi:hypothetical protein